MLSNRLLYIECLLTVYLLKYSPHDIRVKTLKTERFPFSSKRRRKSLFLGMYSLITVSGLGHDFDVGAS